MTILFVLPDHRNVVGAAHVSLVRLKLVANRPMRDLVLFKYLWRVWTNPEPSAKLAPTMGVPCLNSTGPLLLYERDELLYEDSVAVVPSRARAPLPESRLAAAIFPLRVVLPTLP
jgi:hypothetical protein